jgi:ketosteroid isomerase-like protein
MIGYEPQLRALEERYFNALDRRDFEAIGDCFASAATSVYLGGDWQMEGRAEIVERLEKILEFESTIHAPATMSFAEEGGEVKGEVFATATIAYRTDGESRVMVRGLRYRDRLVEEADGWRIAHREQDPLWQYEIDPVVPAIPGGA